MIKVSLVTLQILLFAGIVLGDNAAAPLPVALAHFTGAEFNGGAKDVYGTSEGIEMINTIYSQAAGPRATMELKFTLSSLPGEPLFVHLKARRDGAMKQCGIVIEVNGQTLFKGPAAFSSEQFVTQKYAIAAGALKVGENKLAITCTEKAGRLGYPPWFRVADCAIAPEKFMVRPDLHKDFHVKLPVKERPFPEPLPPGAEPGFKLRGTKGYAWTPKQYLSEIPYLVQFKMNFLMNCYLSMFDIEHHTNWSDGDANRWWEDLSAEKKAAYEKVVRACQQQGIQFCFSMNPNLRSKRFVNDESPESVDQLFKHYAWMQSLGVKWFNISLDDISQGINATTQAKVVNEIFHRLRAKDATAQMIFCPTYYSGDGTRPKQQEYLEGLAKQLDKDIYLFWTGDAVIGKVTRKAADTFRRISGHRLFLWDNYPVNDNHATLNLGPVIDRDPTLGDVIDGYMGNAQCKENESNRLPLATCADYAYNPLAYDPERSIGQAILHLAKTPAQRLLLADVVENYAGFLIYSITYTTGYNPVRREFERLIGTPFSRQAALGYIQRFETISQEMKTQFPDHYQAEKTVIDGDLKMMKTQIAARYP